jgi:hypothetical protein
MDDSEEPFCLLPFTQIGRKGKQMNNTLMIDASSQTGLALNLSEIFGKNYFNH